MTVIHSLDPLTLRCVAAAFDMDENELLRVMQGYEMVDGTVIPMFVTSQLPDGSWVRIPTHAATVADIQSSLEMRQRQLEEDRAALDRFRVFVNKVLAVTSDPTAVIGAVIAATVRDGAA